jgi:hypothetical protein
MMAAKLLGITPVKEVSKPNVERLARYNVTLELYWSSDTYWRWKIRRSDLLEFGCGSNSDR